ncbi:OmpH family outer membrane protein [Fulvivirgaceae bacterium PWU4]|uniref:OmpH family outer membrane protein n=1 Tax=Chryseosolibacter histidini TaxID=2782349 RepID=A0AAP2DMN9_9BACT|nr:OmpH family outer membrane protein [Chryseosolibacter histidini]MBT1699180.1 OmpH family outer membrane protein [Chryseosolibacter histidini]
MKNILLTLNFLLIIGLGIYVIAKPGKKTAFILNQQVFNAFEGKKELEKKLNDVKARHQHVLDSVGALIGNSKDDPKLLLYQQYAQHFRIEQEQTTEQYTADIWKRINQHVADYGKENGYDFILGASGDGSLMYAEEGNNITEEVIVYLNERYKKGV